MNSDPSAYCREIEGYLCRKNGGHLVRIVGPAFEMVRGWAQQGVPLKVAFRGIDRACERRLSQAQRRRPLRIEFCEADVLAAFDDWRRAIGTSADRVSESAAPPKPLAAHIERSLARLLAVRLNGHAAGLAAAIAEAVSILDGLTAAARHSRGQARAEIIARLAQVDELVMSAARHHIDPAAADALRKEAATDLAAFAGRMSADARSRAEAAAYDRLLRESLKLPEISYE